jgi:hypothetical protein
MTPALCLSDLPLPFDAAVRLAAEGGFSHVVVAALEDRSPDDYEALADAGVVVAGAILSNAPAGCTLDDADVGRRRKAVESMKRQLGDAARLGAQFAILLPASNATAEGRRWFMEACAILADHAAARMVRLAVSHRVGNELPAQAGFLLDMGECRTAGEILADCVARAGSRLICVRLPADVAASSSCSAELQQLRQAGFRGVVVLSPEAASVEAVARTLTLFR